MKFIDKDEVVAYLKLLKPELEEKGIDRIGLFGSVANGKADMLSDIDVMVRTTPKFAQRFKGVEGFLYLENLKETISRHFGRKVDICDEAGLNGKQRGDVIYA